LLVLGVAGTNGAVQLAVTALMSVAMAASCTWMGRQLALQRRDGERS
jgi:hypothetical protein